MQPYETSSASLEPLYRSGNQYQGNQFDLLCARVRDDVSSSVCKLIAMKLLCPKACV